MKRLLGAFFLLAMAAVTRLPILLEGADNLPVNDYPPAHSESLTTASNLSPEIPERSAVYTVYRRDPLRFLSTAPVDSLVLLPGIGPVIAERMAGARTGKRLFTWEDVLAIKGIGPKKINDLRELAKSTD